MKQHFHREINDLYTQIAKLGGMVEEAIGKAIASLYDGDLQVAGAVRAGDDRIDQLEVAIEERCLKILALYQPVARDLRFLVTVLKVNNELEHMGDLAEHIARKATIISKSKMKDTRLEIATMAAKTQRMVGQALDALLNEDGERAREVIRMDDEIDAFHIKHHKIVEGRIEEGERDFGVDELKMLSVSRSLERIADMAASIAEDVVYFTEGTIIRHRWAE